MHRSVVRTLAVAGAATALACGDQSSPTGLEEGSGAEARNGPAIEAAITATGFRERRTEYDWSISKRIDEIHYGEQMLLWPSVTEYSLKTGETIWISYEIDVERTELPARSVVGARGTACVVNRGNRTADGLAVSGVVQATSAGTASDIATFDVLTDVTTLAKGASDCWPYEVEFQPVNGATYRVSLTATTSGSASAATAAAFTIPGAEIATTVDDRAIIDDGMRADSVAKWWERGPCAERWPLFQCTSPGDPGIWPRSSSGRISFMVDYLNRMACEETHRLTNVATLTESGYPGRAPQVRTASASLLIVTDPCPPADGCTLTQGYWKQSHHAWPGPGQYEQLYFRHWPFFDSERSWQVTFDTPARGDAYLILAHQYMAATLNIANGADAPDDIRAVRQAAANWFSLTSAERALVSRETLTQWADALARFNEGRAGVPHCG
jgi:hypothetical protein